MSLQKMSKAKNGGSYWRKHLTIGQKRTSMRLGRLSEKNAIEISSHINVLLEAQKHNTDLPARTKAWLRDTDVLLVKKLARYGLCPAISDPSLAKFVTTFKAKKKHTVAPRTLAQFDLVEKHLLEFFGTSKRLRAVTKMDADSFYEWLLGREGLNTNTCNRRVGRVREIFNLAMEEDLIDRNPFKKKTISVTVRAAKKQELTEATVLKIVEHCPTTEWKLLFVFARWIGCRIPSEIKGLTWADVDWERNAILVRSPKTAHRGKPERLVPLFDQVRIWLEKQFEEVEDGEIYVFPTLRHHGNLATTAIKIVEKSKVPVWKKFWNTFRANRETDLMDTHGIRKACAYIGNTPRVAMENYRVQKGTDFDDERRLQKCTTRRTTHARDSQSSDEKEDQEPPKNTVVAHPSVAEAGLETPTRMLGNNVISEQAYNDVYNIDPDLAVLVTKWKSSLDNDVKERILDLAKCRTLN